jgi:hypothetical protein
MKVSGFTFVRNATLYGLPVVESIRSILPLVDEFIVNVGVSDDATLRLVRGIGGRKLKVFETKWDDRFAERMRIYAVQTNLALYRCTGDWCFYLQADEVVHEKDHDAIYRSMERDLKDPRVQGLLFDWVHFWGDPGHFLDTYVNYQKEVRIVRNFLGISSWLDAQGFRLDGRKLRVRPSGGTIYHYGWAVAPEKAVEKTRNHSLYYRGAKATGLRRVPARDDFYNSVHPYFLSAFKGTHPAVMKKFILSSSSAFVPGAKGRINSLKTAKRIFLTFLNRLTGLRPGEYRNYTPVR